MPYIIRETDRVSELITLHAELERAKERKVTAGEKRRRFIDKQISQINRDIARNRNLGGIARGT